MIISNDDPITEPTAKATCAIPVTSALILVLCKTLKPNSTARLPVIKEGSSTALALDSTLATKNPADTELRK